MNLKIQNKGNIILLFGVISYLILVSIAGYYFKERTVFMDVAFRIFHIAKDADFAIQAGRFGEALTQWIPLVGSLLELPIKWIAISYSVGVVCYYFVIFLLCILLLKQEKFALLLLLFNVFMVSYTFWWMQIEFAQAIALSILTFAWITKAQTLQHFLNWKGILLALMLHTLFYFHPLMPIVLLYFLLFFRKTTSFRIDNSLFYTVIIFIVVEYLVKFLFLGNSSYDSVAIKGLDNFEGLFPNYFDIVANQNFLTYCWTDYYLLPIALVSCVAFYLYQRNKYKISLLICSFFGYLLLVNVSNYKGMAQFHIESFYLPLSVFLLCPLIFDIFPKIKSIRLYGVLIGAVLIFRIYHIQQLHQPYTARVDWYENLISKVKESDYTKVILSSDDVPLDTIWQTWASSQEIWLLSKMENPSMPSSIILTHKPDKFGWAMKKEEAFFTEWEIFDYEKLPVKYFNFLDTSMYKVVEMENL